MRCVKSRCGTSANTGVNVHIYADGLIRQNFEWFWLRTNTFFARAIVHIQDIVAGRQPGAVISLCVRGKAGNFAFPITA